MAAILTTNPEFTTRYLLTLRSPWAFIHRLVDIALRFAALGYVDEAVELLEMADAYVPIPARSIHDIGLYFAFQAADWWPDFTPDEDMEDEDLLRSLDVLTVNTSVGKLLLDQQPGPRDVGEARDRRDLSRVLQFLKDREGSWEDREGFFTGSEKREEEDVGDEGLHRGPVKSRLTMTFDSAVLFGFHLAINKLDDQEATETLCEVIGGDLEHYLPRLARYRFVWRVLVRGILGPKTEDGKKEVQAEFERLKGVVKRRMKNGVEFPFLDDGMRDLVKMLDQNTRRHVQFLEDTSSDEDGEEKWSPSIPISSIRHPGASKKSIEELELRLDVELPSDYKEFLSISDGMDGIWNGHYRQRLLAPSSKIHHKNPPKPDPDSAPFSQLILLSLIPGMELPENFGVVWPILKPEACLVIAGDKEGGGEGSLWLVRAYVVRKARNRLMKRIEMLKEGNDGEEQKKQRRWVERLVGDYFGGLEELGELGEGEKWEKEEGVDVMHWAVVCWDERGLPTEVWSSFREWMENAVVKSEFPDIVLEKRDLRS
ncbi:uncharacterized protein K444DRAFT_257991 [Hyaloscypha bicolor E]|uniref:Knr4/Smi1-like domain-containing protein n=1 Tax=Hyaloscypha bicolor E TaxID=1095630 RepID=A0A2J6SNJ6_9HELO|nr:uncharacterized protein K444DRAFT_257991 [Hyaloscypha bicolor E]PMD52290.1 hypothetical protein K444DRAFT_257991 [Hyaloscypha bicolor E]